MRGRDALEEEIHVRRVSSRRDRVAALSFVREPPDDVEAWAPPDLRAYREALHASARRKSDVHALLAEGDDGPVATIVLTIERARDVTEAVLGHFEARPGAEPAVDRLFAEALEIARGAGAVRASGPRNGHPRFALGCRDDRFHEAPVFGVPHGRPEYPGHWWRQGFRATRSLYSFRFDLSAGATRSAIERPLDRDPALTFRPLGRDAWPGAIPRFAEVAGSSDRGAAWSQFPPPFLPGGRDLCWVAEESGRWLGFLFAVPDWNQALRGSVHGPESLRGRLRARVRARRIDRVALLDLVVVPAARQRGIANTLVAHALGAYARAGYREAEACLVPDDDAPAQRVARRFAGAHTTTHRLFERPV